MFTRKRIFGNREARKVQGLLCAAFLLTSISTSSTTAQTNAIPGKKSQEKSKESQQERSGEIAEGLSKKNAHPNAVQLLTDQFYWDCTDEDSPFGNDTGADTLSFFRKWKKEHPKGNPMDFIQEACERFEAPLAQWKQLNWKNIGSPPDFVKMFVLQSGDEIAIATAFGQLVLDGTIDRPVCDFAKQAIVKELDGTGSWSHPIERKTRLNAMLAILNKF